MPRSPSSISSSAEERLLTYGKFAVSSRPSPRRDRGSWISFPMSASTNGRPLMPFAGSLSFGYGTLASGTTRRGRISSNSCHGPGGNWDDGSTTADPAQWHDWIGAVHAARSGSDR